MITMEISQDLTTIGPWTNNGILAILMMKTRLHLRMKKVLRSTKPTFRGV